MKKLALTGLLLATFLTYSCETPERRGDTASTQEQQENGTAMSDDDRDFLQEAAKRNLYDLELARLAQERAVTEDVKQFAQNILNEHGKVQEELKQFAQQRNVMLPDSIDSDQRNNLSDLAQKEGFEFDTEFMDKMVERHNETLDRFESKAEDAEDPQLREWAQNTVPTLRNHKHEAENVEAVVERKKEAQQES
ncbi:MAG: DUF4142 domain-containing protein [Cytophagaceae bacterium]